MGAPAGLGGADIAGAWLHAPPLASGFGAVVSVLGTGGAYVATEIVFGFVALGVLVAAAFDIAWRLSSAVGGAVAALLVVTSTPILVWTARASYDLAFAALALAALALEVARPRRGWLPLSLLVLTGAWSVHLA